MHSRKTAVMAMQSKRSRTVTALLAALVLGTFASLAMGQSHLANPRFRRRATKQYPVRQSRAMAARKRATQVRQPAGAIPVP